MSIVVEHLTFGYTDEPIIIDASFAVAPGEFVGVIGPNGGGKTTLLQLLMGFLDPVDGSVLINNQSPKNYPNRIAYVPQIMRFDRAFPMTLFDVVLGGRVSSLSLWGWFRNEDVQAADDVLAQVGLSKYKDKSFHELSGGQCQKAFIARALVSKPQILLLDEPTAHIDATSEHEILACLKQLQTQQNLTILMVTHDVETMLGSIARFLCVQGTIVPMQPKEICEHFALGLYHYPLESAAKEHVTRRRRP